MSYYVFMEEVAAVQAKEWADAPEVLEVLKDVRGEIDLFHKYSDYFS